MELDYSLLILYLYTNCDFSIICYKLCKPSCFFSTTHSVLYIWHYTYYHRDRIVLIPFDRYHKLTAADPLRTFGEGNWNCDMKSTHMNQKKFCPSWHEKSSGLYVIYLFCWMNSQNGDSEMSSNIQDYAVMFDVFFI